MKIRDTVLYEYKFNKAMWTSAAREWYTDEELRDGWAYAWSS